MFLLPCPQQTNKKGCCSSNTSGSGSQGWVEYPRDLDGAGAGRRPVALRPQHPAWQWLEAVLQPEEQRRDKVLRKSQQVSAQRSWVSIRKNRRTIRWGRLCVPRPAHLSPAPGPGPDAHFLGILVGFPYSTRVASTLPPILLHPPASCSLVYPVCRKSHIPQT